jgi:hypothetical protein
MSNVREIGLQCLCACAFTFSVTLGISVVVFAWSKCLVQ